MKKIIVISFSIFAFLTLFGTQANAGSIKYYGSKAGLFRACKGDLVAVCKEVTTDTKLNTKIDDSLISDIAPLSVDDDDWTYQQQSNTETEEVTVIYDGVEYVIPANAINWEDGSINPDKL